MNCRTIIRKDSELHTKEKKGKMGRVEESEIQGVFLVVSDHILSFKAIKIFWSI